MLIDTHCHINSLSEPLQKETCACNPKDYRFIDISIDLASARTSLTLSAESEAVYTSLGFHPFSASSYSTDTIQQYKKYIEGQARIVAIGEVGLDYTADLRYDEQKTLFEEFIRVAQAHNLPLIVHNRGYNEQMFDILSNYYSDFTRIVFHCFSQDEPYLARILAKGGYASFSLNILRNKKNIITALTKTPLDKLLLETDSPYMKLAGEQSTPRDIAKVYAFVAQQRGMSLESLERALYENVCTVFGIAG